MPTLDRLLTVPQSASLAAVSPGKFEELIRDKQTPEVVHVGGFTRLRASDIDLWLSLGCPDRAEFDVAKKLAVGGHVDA